MIDHAHAAKPDPREPWRYVCPCGGQVRGKENRVDRPYLCVRCGEFLDRGDLRDKKRQAVTP